MARLNFGMVGGEEEGSANISNLADHFFRYRIGTTQSMDIDNVAFNEIHYSVMTSSIDFLMGFILSKGWGS